MTLSQQLFFNSLWKHLHQLGTFGFCWYGSIFKSFHRFSLGFKSGLWGCLRTFTFLVWSISNTDLAACLSPVGGEIYWPHSQAFGTQKFTLKICLCLDPCIVPLDLWQSLPVLPGQVWSCTVVLQGMYGVRGLISSAQFQQTLCISWSILNFISSDHRIFCIMLSVFHTSLDQLQAAAMFDFCIFLECLCWQFLFCQVILSWFITLEFCQCGL